MRRQQLNQTGVLLDRHDNVIATEDVKNLSHDDTKKLAHRLGVFLLTNLRQVNLCDNYLSGTIPTQISYLTNLEVLAVGKTDSKVPYQQQSANFPNLYTGMHTSTC